MAVDLIAPRPSITDEQLRLRSSSADARGDDSRDDRGGHIRVTDSKPGQIPHRGQSASNQRLQRTVTAKSKSSNRIDAVPRVARTHRHRSDSATSSSEPAGQRPANRLIQWRRLMDRFR
jgi:hypothetical protein